MDKVRKQTLMSFVVFICLFSLGVGAWAWVVTRPDLAALPAPLRRVHEWNERLSRLLFRPKHLAPTFAESEATEPRVNGKIGMQDDDGAFDPGAWRLQITGNGKTVELSIDDIRALPRFEMTTQFKCIEGWSNVVHWSGARLADLIVKYDLLSDRDRKNGYVALSTPDESYYVGLEMESALHPQTLLAYEMNRKPLTVEHGAPLRLATPLKYGIKNIKRIGHITVGPERPADYWAELGYDWYSGH